MLTKCRTDELQNRRTKTWRCLRSWWTFSSKRSTTNCSRTSAQKASQMCVCSCVCILVGKPVWDYIVREPVYRWLKISDHTEAFLQICQENTVHDTHFWLIYSKPDLKKCVHRDFDRWWAYVSTQSKSGWRNSQNFFSILQAYKNSKITTISWALTKMITLKNKCVLIHLSFFYLNRLGWKLFNRASYIYQPL